MDSGACERQVGPVSIRKSTAADHAASVRIQRDRVGGSDALGRSRGCAMGRRPARGRLCACRGALRRSGFMRGQVRARCALPRLELLVSDPAASGDLLAQIAGHAARAKPVLRLRCERRCRARAAGTDGRDVDRPPGRRLPPLRCPARFDRQSLCRRLPSRSALSCLDLCSPWLSGCGRCALLSEGPDNASSPPALLRLGRGAVRRVLVARTPSCSYIGMWGSGKRSERPCQTIRPAVVAPYSAGAFVLIRARISLMRKPATSGPSTGDHTPRGCGSFYSSASGFCWSAPAR